MRRTSPEAMAQFEAEKAAYDRLRPELLKLYEGKWVAIVNGKVAGVADQMNKAGAAAIAATGRSLTYVACVGRENVPLRVRAVSTGRYDPSLAPPIPVVEAEVAATGMLRRASVRFIVDTGADLTLVRESDAGSIDPWDDLAGPVMVSGLGSPGSRRDTYWMHVCMADRQVLVAVDCRDDLDENILGRDVLNEFRLELCASENHVRSS